MPTAFLKENTSHDRVHVIFTIQTAYYGSIIHETREC